MSTLSPFRDGAELETPLAVPGYGEQPWQRAEDEEPELFDLPATEWEEEVPPVPSSRLEWPGATEQKLAFMRAVYERHFDDTARSGRRFVANLTPDELAVIEGRHQAREEAAKAARALLVAARAKLAADGLDGKVRIGILSAYRPAEHQFDIWQGKGRKEKGGFPYYYRQAIKEGAVTDGDYGPAAVESMARYIGQYIAAPGFSNHQDGLAIDFGTGSVGGNDFGGIGRHSWFHHWLVENAPSFGYHPYVKEAWHWTYRKPATYEWEAEAPPAAVRARRIKVDDVLLLRRHSGQPPALVLGWNDMTAVPAEIDVVVHLHGYWLPSLDLRKDIEPYSGLDLVPPKGTAGLRRTRPTLTVLPRGNDTGKKQTNGKLNIYNFPALVTKDGLDKLITFSLDRFASEVRGTAPKVGRLILTAHSGGGAALMQILRHHDPDQVHVFDALYGPPDALTDWLGERIRRDAAAVKGLTPADRKAYMASRGGALRVFYQGGVPAGTRPFSLQVRAMVCDDLRPELKAWYRVEASKHGHLQIPQNHGWRVLGDASTDDPDAYVEHAVKHQSQPEVAEVEDFFQDDLETEEQFEAEEFARHALYESDLAAEESPTVATGSRRPILRTAQLRTAWSAYECAEHRMVDLRMFGRWNTPVNPLTVDAWRALERALVAVGYDVHRAWVFNCRDIRRRKTRSLHAYGLAIDIDHSHPTCNPNRATPDGRAVRFSSAATKEARCRDVQEGKADTSFTPDQVAAVEAIRTVDGHQVFAWGGRWDTTKDTMHFQINVTPDELARGIRPDSVRQHQSTDAGGELEDG